MSDTVRLDRVFSQSGEIQLYFSANSPNPHYFGAPGIKYNLVVTLLYHGRDKPLDVKISGNIQAFPAYEVIIRRENGGMLIVGRSPRDHGNGPFGLLSSEQVEDSDSVPPSGSKPKKKRK